jgi:hypothetical protein
MGSRIRLALELLLIAVVVVAAVVAVRDFGKYADHFPYLAVDDALANVSYSIATHGRNGFLASPTQGFTNLTRHRGFFGYGPWYFDVGAGLIWLLGYNLSMLRGIHLAGIVIIAAAACWWFGRRGALASGALMSIGILRCFDLSQWPMVRPDIAVSVFAIVFVVAAGLALERPQQRATPYWWLAGLGAGGAAFSHLIAWALVPCCVLVLVAALATERTPRPIAVRQITAVGLGLLSAAAMFYASFGFRVRDHVASLLAYQQFLTNTDGASGGGYSAVLGKHLQVAFAYLASGEKALLAASVALGLALLIASVRREPAERRRDLACLLPPLAVLLCYGLSLGRYPNYHAGYAILTQVGAWWCAAAALCVATDRIAERSSVAMATLPVVVTCLIIFMGVFHLANRSAVQTRLQRVNEWVSIHDFTHEVEEPIPVGSAAWGSIFFGIENPGRVQLVQLAEGLGVVERARRAGKVDLQRIAPDYVLWGYPENRDNTLQLLQAMTGAGAAMFFSRVAQGFPGVNYHLTALVIAPPYGVTRLYARAAGSDEHSAEPPLVSSYDPIRGTWERRIEGPLDRNFTAVAPVTFAVGYASAAAAVRADRSVVAEVPAGRILLRARVIGSKDASRRALAVTPSPAWREVITELGSIVDFAPYAEHERNVYLLYEHSGGPLYVSQFDDGRGASIESVDVYMVRPRGDDDPRARPELVDMPPLPSWLPLTSAGVQARIEESGTLVVDGDATLQGYQIKSPAVAVGAGSTVTARTAFAGKQGKVCVGALNATEAKWLASAGDPGRDFSFTVDETGAFRLAFYNCNTGETGNLRSRFSVSSPRYFVESATLYVDRLMSVLDSPQKTAPAPDRRVRSFPPGLVIPEDRLAPPTPLSRSELQFVAPIVQGVGDGWAIRGRAESAYSYVLVSKPQDVPNGRRLVVIGRVDVGGVTVGLLKKDRWAGQVNVSSPGEFTAVVEAPAPGSYAIVVANNVGDPSLHTDVEISRIGWIPR